MMKPEPMFGLSSEQIAEMRALFHDEEKEEDPKTKSAYERQQERSRAAYERRKAAGKEKGGSVYNVKAKYIGTSPEGIKKTFRTVEAAAKHINRSKWCVITNARGYSKSCGGWTFERIEYES